MSTLDKYVASIILFFYIPFIIYITHTWWFPIIQRFRKNKLCAICNGPHESKWSIHRDGFGEGPEVFFCQSCFDTFHTCEEIWDVLSLKRQCMKPISPNELTPNIPAFVINCINNLIRQEFNYFSKEAVIGQDVLIDDVVSAAEKCGEYTNSTQIFYTGWLDFEDIFREAGWTVVCRRAAYWTTSEKMEYVFTKPTKGQENTKWQSHIT